MGLRGIGLRKELDEIESETQGGCNSCKGISHVADKTSNNKSIGEKDGVINMSSNIECLRPDLYDTADEFIEAMSCGGKI
jgi:hypothetical protein